MEGLAELARSRTEIDALASADPANDLLRLFRCYAAVCQAGSVALWSRENSAPVNERRERLAQAEAALAVAEAILPSLKAKLFPEKLLNEARTLIAIAKDDL
jgi:hypothetical protein